MKFNPIKVLASRDRLSLTINFFVTTENLTHIADLPTFRPMNPDECVNPTFSLEAKGAQALMDQLWDCGFRPSQSEREVGALKATERHLEDMRSLVFKFKENQP